MTSALVAFAADHAGYDLKQALIREFEATGGTAIDLGTHSADSVDYPDMADVLARCMADGRTDRGVIVCGTGIGIAIAANRHRHVRAAVCHDVTSARLTRLHNDANVLALGARLVGSEVAKDCLRVFLETEFEGGRHARRVAKLG
ncbi:MAG: ribose 5-phosphate isomerase B [Alphaproteobacteria bacterium]|nr:ribose 5-phosphate isomerase B [Alphaproteobacteria bacterium]